MALQAINPAEVAPPFSNYSQAIVIAPNARVAHVSGQLGVDATGTLKQGFAAQMEQALANVLAVLAGAGMTHRDIAKLTVFSKVSDEQAVSDYRVIRDRMLEGHAPAATFVVVSGFTKPEFLVEIEAVAAAE